MHYYKFNIADFNNATRHLNRLERGIYRDLIDHYYDSERPITNDKKILCRKILANTEEEIEAVDVILNEFFFLRSDNWHHERIDLEVKKYTENADTARVNGRKGGRPKNPEITQSVNLNNPEVTQKEPNAKLTNNYKPLTINHKPIKIIKNKGNSKLSPVCIIDLYNNFFKDSTAIMKLKPTTSLKQRLSTMAKTEFETKEDWVSFFEYIEMSDFLMGKVPPNSGYRQFKLKLEWLTAPSNLAKILERHYHGQ